MIYLRMFLIFMKIGAFTFGGGYAMLPIIQEEVLRHGWMSMEELVNFIAVSEGTPGPFAVNISTYVGYETSGIIGALAASIGVILPSFIVIIIVAGSIEKFDSSKLYKNVMKGVRAAVVGLVGVAVYSTANTVFGTQTFSTSVVVVDVIIGAVAILLYIKKLHPIFIIFISAAINIVYQIIVVKF